MRRNRNLLISLAMLAVLAMAGCAGQPLSDREKGTGLGAILGGGTGAIIGAVVGHPAAGAAIGGAMGGIGGYAVGNEMDNQNVQERQTQGAIHQQQREIRSQHNQIEQLRQEQDTE